MEDDIFESYAEWANDELVWGKGMFNWCRAYTQEEWERKPEPDKYPDIKDIPF